MYYTDKQRRVFKAIVKNQEANIQEVAEIASVHPSYVRYIINRLPKDKASDVEWLREKAGITAEDLEEDTDGEEEESTDSEEETESSSLMESFGVEAGEEVDPGEGVQVSMVRYLPVSITVTIPEDLIEEENSETSRLLKDPKEVRASSNAD